MCACQLKRFISVWFLIVLPVSKNQFQNLNDYSKTACASFLYPLTDNLWKDAKLQFRESTAVIFHGLANLSITSCIRSDPLRWNLNIPGALHQEPRCDCSAVVRCAQRDCHLQLAELLEAPEER